jgi:hypothetical protein
VATAQDTGAVLGELSSTGTPWFAIDMAGIASPGWLARSAGQATVIDIADLNQVPVAVNPLEPGPGYPIQAHADRVAGLFEAAFGLAEPVAAAIRAGLRRSYAACGWDTRTGTTSPGAVTSPAVPAFRQFSVAVLAAAEDLGYSQSMQAGVRGFLRTRLDALWAGPAGRFLEGGHPVDIRSLLRGNVLVTNSGAADDAAAAFLTGVMLIRLGEQLRPRRREGQGAQGAHGALGAHGAQGAQASERARFAVVIGSAGVLDGHLASARPGAGWFGRLLGDIRSCGADTIVTRWKPEAAPVAPGGPAEAFSPVLLGRRSAACGERCRRRPCHGYELHAATLLAHDDGQAWTPWTPWPPWLRLWVQTLVLAFLTGRPVPRVPALLRSGWQALSPRRRECMLATVIDTAVTARATALRPSYDPRCLTSVIAALATRMLDAAARGDVPRSAGTVLPWSAAPFRAGQVWVIPQLRWLSELERVSPLGHDEIRFDDIAPPLDFGLAGLPDWPGIRVRDRLSGLRRHRLSMDSERNRVLASVALLGDDDRAGFDADLAIAGMGLRPVPRLRHAARMMGAGAPGQDPGWLEVVLSWPERIIRPALNSDVRRTATG